MEAFLTEYGEVMVSGVVFIFMVALTVSVVIAVANIDVFSIMSLIGK